jgi:hypothetical protein
VLQITIYCYLDKTTWIFFKSTIYGTYQNAHNLSLLQSRNDQAIQQRYPHLDFKSLNEFNLSNQLDQSNETLGFLKISQFNPFVQSFGSFSIQLNKNIDQTHGNL